MRLGRGGESVQLFVRRPSLVSLQIFVFYLFFGGVWGRLEGQTKRSKTDAAFKTSAMPKLWNDWVLCRVILWEEEVATLSLLLLLQRFLPSSRSISLGVLNAAARQLRPSSGVAFKRLLPSTDAALVAWPWRVTVQLVFFHLKCQHLKVNRGLAHCFPDDRSALWIKAATQRDESGSNGSFTKGLGEEQEESPAVVVSFQFLACNVSRHTKIQNEPHFQSIWSKCLTRTIKVHFRS